MNIQAAQPPEIGALPTTENSSRSTAAVAASPPGAPGSAAGTAEASPPRVSAVQSDAHQVHAFMRQPYEFGCAVPGCGLAEAAAVHHLIAGAPPPKRSILVPDNWLDALKSGDPRFAPETRERCSYCRALRTHSPAVHVDELAIAGAAS